MPDFPQSSIPFLDFPGRRLDLSRPHVMGILNVTPDSFSDGGELLAGGRVSLDLARRRAGAMAQAGAAFIDIGGESTRPGAAAVSSAEELDRVLPVVEAVARELDVIVSVDTSNPDLMRECAGAGAGLINDVRAHGRPGALQAAAASGLPVCLMHMQGEPATMQREPHYDDVVGEIADFLAGRVRDCEAAGIPAGRIVLDPGFGFGKTLEHNVELLSRLETLLELKLPLLVGLSRKRMVGALTGREAKDRTAGSVAAAVVAVMKGARIVRTHDVAETVDAMKICGAVMERRQQQGQR